MRIVIISCTAPDDPVNEDDCKMKKKKKSPSTPLRVCFVALITELDNMSRDCHPQAYELHLILDFCWSLDCPIILQTQADPS